MSDTETMPRFVRAAQRLADERGTSVDEILQEDERGVLSSGYPTPECLLPHEVEAFFAGASRTEIAHRMRHVEVCTSCSAVLRAARGNDEEFATIRAALHRTATAPTSPTGISPVQAGALAAAGGLALAAWGVRRWLRSDRQAAPAQPAPAAEHVGPRATAG